MLGLLIKLFGIRRPEIQRIVLPLDGIATKDEVTSLVQNTHCTGAAQFIAIIELLAEKGILNEGDQNFLQKRKTYWLSQFDQMVEQRKDDLLKDALNDFRRRQG